MNNGQAPILVNKNACNEKYIKIKKEHFDNLSYLLKDKSKQFIMMILLMSTPNGYRVSEK